MSKNTSVYFQRQTDITKQKLEFYKQYIESYSMKLLMWFWVLFIADLFCWEGYNWENKGSPLILIDILNKVLQSPTLLNSKPKAEVILLLNDWEKVAIDTLEKHLKEYNIDKRITILYKNLEFNWILPIVQWLKNYKAIPKFFFLDPFTFSSIKVQDLKILTWLEKSEILMFSPVFDAYRFKTAKNLLDNEDHKTRKYIEDFTSWGLIDYSDIYEFNSSILLKLKQELGTEFVKYILLNWGSRQNALFHITNHISWSLLFTKTSRKLWDYWMWIDVVFKKATKLQWCLFNVESISCNHLTEAFEEKLVELLKQEKKSNKEIFEFSVVNGFLPIEASQILKKINDKLIIQYTNGWRNGYYLWENAWKEEIKCYIKYKV